MRKIPSWLENPFNNVLLYIVERTFWIPYIFGATPNTITTFSLVTGAFSVLFLYYDYFTISSLLYLWSYFFDTMDGFMARKYKMITQFGDYYDHIKDISVCTVLFFVLNTKLVGEVRYILLLIFPLLITMTINIGYQEIYMKVMGVDNGSRYLSFTTKIAKFFIYPKDYHTVLKVLEKTRWCESGTFVVILITAIYCCHFSS